MANPREDLRWINIPNPVTGEIYERIEVEPITDQWLLAKDRTWREVDEILEGRIGDFQKAFQDPQKAIIKVGPAYGIERPVNSNMARLLAHAELFDEYKSVADGYKAEAESLRKVFDEEREIIKRGPGSQGKKQQRLDEIGREKYHAPIASATVRSQEAAGIQSLILRKAMTDIFSTSSSHGQPLILDLPRIVTQARDLRQEKGDKEKDPVGNLLDALTDYLATTIDLNVIKEYSYRDSEGMVATASDCAILAQSLTLLDNLDGSISDPTQKKLGRLGQAYFRFLYRQASVITPQVGYYPTLSLLYDTYTAAFSTGKEAVVKNVDIALGKIYGENKNSPRVKNEISTLLRKRLLDISPFYVYFAQHRDLLSLPDDPIILREKMSHAFRDHLTGNEERIFSGLLELRKLGESRPDLLPTGFRGVLNSLAHGFERTQVGAINYLPSTYGSLQERSFLIANIEDLSIMPYLAEKGIEVDLTTYIYQIRNQEQLEQEISRKVLDNPRGEILQKVFEEGKDLPKLQEHFLYNYILFADEAQRSSEEIEGENEFLWNGILDRALWFVSPRGDRFNQRGDPQLEDLLIDSLTFRVDPTKPREHSVNVRFSGIDHNFLFWLDTRKNLMSSEHQLLILAPEYQQRFANILLKRLYTITSGLLSTDTVEAGEESQGTRNLAVKRAHYRILTSNPNYPITMESQGAHTHAEEIRKDYGIDIYGEITRRRNAGSLEANQYLTFVRESAPEGVTNLMLPNQLRFDPTVIPFPIAS